MITTIDRRIENLIYLLNKAGLTTEYSCEGHKLMPMDGYIMFHSSIDEEDILELIECLPEDRINNFRFEKSLRSVNYNKMEMRSNWIVRFPVKKFNDKDITMGSLKDRYIRDLENAAMIIFGR